MGGDGMVWANYHTHCRLCDGKGELRDYALEAESRGLVALGFSCHAPAPVSTEWHMRAEDLAGYVREVRALRDAFAGRLDVFLGLEIDYLPGLCGPRDAQYRDLGLDFTIGSVHFVEQFADGEHWGIDSSPELFERGLREVFGGDIRRCVDCYYSLVRRMLTDHCPDILGHLDVIKKFNRSGVHFDESEAWYCEAVERTLQAVAAAGVILEVNTGHLARGKADAPYPSLSILERVRELGIPITLNSDAHNPTQVAGEFEAVGALLAEMGFRELMLLGSDGWTARPSTRDGVVALQPGTR